jgi:TldD protein
MPFVTLTLPFGPAGPSKTYPSAVDRTRRRAIEPLQRACSAATTVVGVTTPRRVDADFLGLPRHELADAALSAAVAAGASYADLRIHAITTEIVSLRDGELETSVINREIGLAVRVVVDGTWGFASHAELDPAVAAETARRAVRVGTILAPLNAERIELAAEPVYTDVSWVPDYRIDPFDVGSADKIAVLGEYSGRLLAADGVDHVSAGLRAAKEQTFYADTFGSSITQQRVRVMPTLEAVTVDAAAGTFDTMRTLAPPTARGWEVVAGDDVWNWSEELAELPSLLAEKAKAPSVTAGSTDLVIHPSNLWLTIHESIGHATEYDRAIGYEAAYAGTSFATPDKLGTMRYGSQVMNVTADRTVEFGLATVGFDDEGVRAQSWDLVRDGIFVGYQLDRVFAPRLGVARSNGCSYADSPHHVPIQRMANVSLQPGVDDVSTDDLIARVDDGIYIVGDKSWSIDMQRYNFQFTGQRFFRIRDGRLDGQLRDVAYQATTTDFWGSMEAVGGPSTWRLGGAFNCGKAQPGQIAAVSHGCPSALFRGVNVLNTRAEAGR